MTTINTYFTIAPDWKSGVTMTRSWKTGIQMSVTGAEKRSALFTWPRRMLKYKIIGLSAHETAYIKRKIWGHQHQVWGIPIWTDGSQLTATVTSGTATLNVDDTRYREFVVGGKVIIISPISPDSYEIATIASLTQTTITLTAGLTYSWTSFYSVYPVLAVRLQTNLSLVHNTDRYGEITVQATEAYE